MNTQDTFKAEYLTPLDRKSFYGKAVKITQGNTVELKSYETIVATVKRNKLTVNGWYSATTARHINAFLADYNLPRLSKAEMQNKPTFRI